MVSPSVTPATLPCQAQATEELIKNSKNQAIKATTDNCLALIILLDYREP